MGELLLRQVRLAEAGGLATEPRDVGIQAGKLVSLNSSGTSEASGRVLECGGAWLFAGLTDLHVHLRDFEQAYKETVCGGLRAAAIGGFTRVAAMPNTAPPLASPELAREYLAKSQECQPAPELLLLVAASDAEGKLVDPAIWAGAPVAGISDDARPVVGLEGFESWLAKVRRAGYRFYCHLEDKSLSAQGVLDSSISERFGVVGFTRLAEIRQASELLAAAERTGAQIHITHVSCRETLELIREARGRGVDVTCEACPHHFTLSTEDIEPDRAQLYKMAPPLRTPDDVEALVESLADGTIDAIATDHAPHTAEEKAKPLAEAPFGITGLEVALSLTWRLVEQGRLQPEDVVRLLSTGPARVLGLPLPKLAVGEPADLTLFAPDFEWSFDQAQVGGKATNSPFFGRSLKGKPILTIVKGEIVYQEARFFDGRH